MDAMARLPNTGLDEHKYCVLARSVNNEHKYRVLACSGYSRHKHLMLQMRLAVNLPFLTGTWLPNEGNLAMEAFWALFVKSEQLSLCIDFLIVNWLACVD